MNRGERIGMFYKAARPAVKSRAALFGGAAETLLRPAVSSRDPEVRWRLADVLAAQERVDEAEAQLDAARRGFEELLGRHLLAFADHAAEFYAGSGNDCRRAIELARANVANRPTRRAVKQAHAIALSAEAECGQQDLPVRSRRAPSPILTPTTD